MDDDLALSRAAGVIMWSIRNGDDTERAIAKAQEREPQLTTDDIRNALMWAKAGILFADGCNAHAGEIYDRTPIPPDHSCRRVTIADMLDRAGIPWRD